METLKEYYSYENDLDGVTELFENLSRELKIIHSNNMVVPNLNSNEIVFGESMLYKTIKRSDNFELEKRNNILSLAKIITGIYLSSGTEFKDFSQVKDEWFIENFDNIFSTINYPNFDKEYFESIFLEGQNTYYSDYIDRKRQSESLDGKSNVQGYRKVLRNAGSNLYEDLSDIDSNIRDKNANLQTAFNPLLIGLSLTIITVLFIMFILVN